MNSATIAAIIGASAAVLVGVLKLLGKKPKGGITSSVGDLSDSMVAVGTSIHQSFSPTIHNHYGEAPPDADPFSTKTESTPTILDIMNNLETKRKPFEATQVPKLYKGLWISWPVLFYGVWEHGAGWMVRLRSLENQYHSVIIIIAIEKYPKLRVIDRGHRAWVEGRIDRISLGEIYLEDGAQITLE